MLIRLTAEQIQEIHDNELEISGIGIPGTKDPGYLDLLAYKPFTELFGEEMYPGLFFKAAVLMRGLIKGHVFNDCNKRTALITTMTFLDLNGYELDADPDELFEVTIAIAEDRIYEEALSDYLERNCIPTY
ncbi:type II toxin-antitoxin system death-on-curing family toxin [Paenibacillus sp. MMO-58]|uniref:type II toxin-antitoxin system death-on-curing family toxin n=1 Tax=Paenibacillus sp. MMO-58 TaxID=3081290 RepID=UPI00301898C8